MWDNEKHSGSKEKIRSQEDSWKATSKERDSCSKDG